MYRFFFKRVIDILLSFTGLMLSIPFTLIITLALTISHRGNPFFIQERPGKDQKPFRVIKFRTMNDRRDDKGILLPDEKRVTLPGRLVRKMSFDEVPQFINVLKGDMSMIGPRPLLTEYLPVYSPYHQRRHEIRPGITGWAQVNGRNDISWKEKLDLDVWYVDNLSFRTDIKIFFMTIINVIRGEGISKKGFATTEKFNGKN